MCTMLGDVMKNNSFLFWEHITFINQLEFEEKNCLNIFINNNSLQYFTYTADYIIINTKIV